MGTSVKGLLKGLRYISQMFDEKEPEMQIGLPTDVKHVAHIGLDGPAAPGNQNNPSWMNEFKASPQTQTSGDIVNSIRELDLSTANTQEAGEQKPSKAPKSKRQSSSLDSSSAPRNSEKGSRRHRSSCHSADSAAQEGSSRSSRRRRSSNQGTESSSENPAPKPSHRRRSKGSISDGCESAISCSISRDCNSLSDIPLPVLGAVEEEKLAV